MLESVTEEQIYKFMDHMGTKTKHVQDIIFKQCSGLAKSDKPKDILKEVYKRLKKK